MAESFVLVCVYFIDCNHINTLNVVVGAVQSTTFMRHCDMIKQMFISVAYSALLIIKCFIFITFDINEYLLTINIKY